MRANFFGALYVLAAPALGLVWSCASTPGAQPHDMSASQHEAMATSESSAAATHATQYDPDAAVGTERCSHGGGARAGFEGGCWTSVRNPTSGHLEEANNHRKMAADHRAASQALRDAEARACVGLSDEDRDTSPFAHREDIAGVEPLNEHVTSGKSQYTRTTGALITLRAVPGMTAQWLQRVVDCHLARNAAIGHDTSEMPQCPLVPKNVTALVSPTASGFSVAVRSEDTDTVREITRRAQALVAQGARQ